MHPLSLRCLQSRGRMASANFTRFSVLLLCNAAVHMSLTICGILRACERNHAHGSWVPHNDCSLALSTMHLAGFDTRGELPVPAHAFAETARALLAHLRCGATSSSQFRNSANGALSPMPLPICRGIRSARETKPSTAHLICLARLRSVKQTKYEALGSFHRVNLR